MCALVYVSVNMKETAGPTCTNTHRETLIHIRTVSNEDEVIYTFVQNCVWFLVLGLGSFCKCFLVNEKDLTKSFVSCHLVFAIAIIGLKVQLCQ